MIDTAVILAAGRGSRLKEVTATRSKAMVPIAGRPVIARVMDEFRAAGISKFIVVGAPHDTELAAFCATLPVTTFIEQSVPKGSGDALLQCERSAPERFLVCACDSIVPADDLRRVLAEDSPHCVAMIGVIEVAPTVSLSSRSVVVMHGDRVESIVEKPSPEQRTTNLSSLPLYIVSSSVFSELKKLSPSPRGEYELPTAFQSLIGQGSAIRGVMVKSRLDLTDQADLLRLNEKFLGQQAPAVQVFNTFIPTSVIVEGPVLIESDVTLGDGAYIGPFVYLEKGATISSGVRLEHAVVLRGAKVTSNASGRVIA